MVGYDGDGIVEPYELTHALDGLGRRVIHALHPTAEHGRLRKGRDLNPGRPNVDAIDRRAVDLRRGVQTLRRRTDQLEILVRLSTTFAGTDMPAAVAASSPYLIRLRIHLELFGDQR